MPAPPHTRPYRLVAFDADAIDLQAASAIVARLLHAGVVVVAISSMRPEVIVARLAAAMCAPYRRRLIVAAEGGAALFAIDERGHRAALREPDGSGLAARIVRAVAEPRGIDPAECVLIGTSGGVLGDADPAQAHAMTRWTVPPEQIAGALRAQAVLRPVRPAAQLARDPAWQLVEDGFVLAREHEIESLFAVGNGYVGARASLAEGTSMSSPATFVAGVYDLRAERGALPELLRLPDWARVAGRIDGEPLRLDRGEILRHRRVLDLRSGILWREWRHRDPSGRVTDIQGLRLASQADRHLLLQSVVLTPENYGGRLEVEAMLAGSRVLTTNLGHEVGLHVASTLETPEALVWTQGGETDGETLAIDLEAAGIYRLDRVMAVFSSRDCSQPAQAARAHAEHALGCRGVEGLVADHTRAWRGIWDEADVIVDGDGYAQTALRFAIYQLCSAVHPEDEAVSIGARGLTGTGYAGHVFWDTEIYMLPFFTLTRPKAARSMLTYRHRTLDAARARARERGYAGALYAWESADTGEDVTPPFIVAPDGEVLPVLAGEQEQHISADVAYGVWSYWHATRDDAFLLERGAEIVIETARFWASRVELGADARYHIRGVMGPDEYHAGVDDNAYTNGMAQWNLERAADLVTLASRCWPDELRALVGRLELREDESSKWRQIATEMYTGLDEDTGLIEQFRGYFDLERVDLSEHEPRQAAIDVLLGHERIQGSQVIKQPDVLMLLHLLWDRFPAHVREANFRFYEPRTAHGSSLSPPVHAALAARLGDVELAMRYFRQTAEIDLANNMGNAAAGVHMAALGGLWQAAVLGFAGVSVCEPQLAIEPHLPPSWRGMRFGVRWRGRRVPVQLGDTPQLDDETQLDDEVQLDDETQLGKTPQVPQAQQREERS